MLREDDKGQLYFYAAGRCEGSEDKLVALEAEAKLVVHQLIPVILFTGKETEGNQYRLVASDQECSFRSRV
jgi:hypothetical protein